jgi:cell division protein FtsZ
MTINITEPTNEQLKPRITVIGVGGAGCNAVNNMIEAELEGVEFLVANTDAQSLASSLTERKVQLGAKLTKGLGAGAKPEIGREAADESLSTVLDQLEGTHMLFVTAGMGGGTGTGAAPVIAEAARERGILTVGVVTKPFEYEGIRRTKIAEQGIKDLTESVDTLIIIPNQNLFRIANKDTTFTEAFKMADAVLYNGVKGVTDLIVKQGRINLDFADIQTVMLEMGKAMMGTGEATGENRAINAAEEAVSNPLLDDTSIENARGVIINISGGEDVKLYEIDEIAAYIKKQCREDVNLIVGNTIEKIEDGKIRVSLLASGIVAESAIDNDKNKDDNEKFIKPRLVSSRNDDKQENTIKVPTINKEEKKQADLEDFLSKEVNSDVIENKDSDRGMNENFFIPSEEVLPNKVKNSITDPFKEADMLNADARANSNVVERMEEVENNSLISRLTNVKEKVLNAGSNAISMVSEAANKSLENKFSRKEDNQETTKNETDSSNRVEPSFFESSSSKLESTSAILDQNNNLNEHSYDNIPSFLKRNRD